MFWTMWIHVNRCLDFIQFEMRWACITCALFLGAVSCDPVVRTAKGEIRGRTLKSRNGRDYYSFTGIPYAKPPVDGLRFKVDGKHFLSGAPRGEMQVTMRFSISVSGTGGPVAGRFGRYERIEHVSSKQSFLSRVPARDRRPRGLFVLERVHAGRGWKAAGHVLDTRRRFRGRPQRTESIRTRLFYGQRRGVRVVQLQARAAR